MPGLIVDNGGELTLDLALADLAEHPDSSAREIGRRIGRDGREVYRVLTRAAYAGSCQSWSRNGRTWLWELPGCTACRETED